MIDKKIENDFYEGNRSPELPLVINDAVYVVGGKYARKKAAVISLSNFAPELAYLVEFGDGSGDAIVEVKFLELI